MIMRLGNPSAVLSDITRRALAQTGNPPPTKSNLPITIGLVATAVFGIAAGVIPKREKTYRRIAVGGSVISLAGVALLFAFEK